MEDVDENLTCRVCLGLFDDGTRRPLLLPACGHTFCSFCINNLHQKGKLRCPECRKEKAVKAVSSLPVNYSLLNMVESKVTTDTTSVIKTQDKATTKPKAPNLSPDHQNAKFSNPPSAGRADLPTISEGLRRPPVLSQGSRNSQTHQSMPGISRINSLQSRKPVTPVNLQQDLRNSRRPEKFIGENSREAASPLRVTKEKKSLSELQEELDFQMAVHLTFCKDASHGHDDPSCTSHCWQFPEDDDLHTSLSLSQTFKLQRRQL